MPWLCPTIFLPKCMSQVVCKTALGDSSVHCVTAGPLFVVMEYAARGNLHDFLRQCRTVADNSYYADIGHVEYTDVEQRERSLLPTSLSYIDLVSYALQVARGLDYMSSRMVHSVIYINRN